MASLITINVTGLADSQVEALLQSQTQLKELLMATQAELASQLRALKEQNDKATAEQIAKLDELKAALAAAGNTSPEVDSALEELRASIQRDDDLNPDPTTGGETGTGTGGEGTTEGEQPA